MIAKATAYIRETALESRTTLCRRAALPNQKGSAQIIFVRSARARSLLVLIVWTRPHSTNHIIVNTDDSGCSAKVTQWRYPLWPKREPAAAPPKFPWLPDMHGDKLTSPNTTALSVGQASPFRRLLHWL